MFFCKKLALILAFVAVAIPLGGRTRKGDKLWNQGKQEERRKNWDAALQLYEKALSEDPSDPGYQLSTNRARFLAAQHHVDQGQKLRAAGELSQALTAFEYAYAIDPSSSVAEQEIQRTRAMIERERRRELSGEPLNKEERKLTPADVAKLQTLEKIDRIQSVPELKPLSTQAINLKMNNQPPRVLFETLGKVAGVNVLFDPDFTQSGGRNQSIEFNNMTIEESLDHVSVLTKSFWKPLSSNAIFVTQDNTTKRRDYEEQVVKVFYLTNVNTPQELQEIATNVRGICDIRRLFTYNAQMAIIVRAEADRVALAEKVIADLDKPKSEVVIDVLVLEVSKTKTRDLTLSASPSGINTQGNYGPVATTDEDGTSTSTGAQRVRLGNYSFLLPIPALEAVMQDRSTRILQSPQVRAADNFKASLRIGDKVPIASGSFQPGIGGVGINPLVNTQFQFQDVGVNVDITPKIHGPNEVSLHVEVDISNVRERISLGGIEQPVIGQRKVIHDVRMKEGEVNVLSGLMQTQDTKTVNGIPFISSIPLIGRLFSSENVERSEQELLFVLIPHIVRTPEISEGNLRGVAVGNDQVVKLSYAARRSAVTSTPAPSGGQAATPLVPPITAPPATAPPDPAPQPAQPAKPAARLAFSPARAEGQQGSAITVSLTVEGATDLFTVPMRVKYDPKVVHLNDATAGNLLSLDGLRSAPVSKNIQNDTGEAAITVGRLPGAGGINGAGTLVTFTFQAVGKGTSAITFQDFVMRNSRLQESGGTPPEFSITVR